MSELKFKGTLTVIGNTNQVSDKFSKREFVVNDNSMYPQEVQFEFTQDKCSELDLYKVGDEVEVSFNLRGRSWTNANGEVKYFNTLQAWKIEKDAVNYKPKASTEGIPRQVLEDEMGSDDLPF